MKTYRVGVVGCGAVWNYHRLVFEMSDRLTCACVYDPVEERTGEAAALTGARAAASAEEVLTAEDVDIIAVLSPAFTHADYVETGAAAGKHFMLEKPMSTTLDEADRIVQAIDAAGVKCFHPTLRALASDVFEKLQELTAESGPLGPVKSAFFHLVGAPLTRSPWMVDRERCFPPAEYDPHVFDTLLELTGDEPSSVFCHKGRYCRSFEQDDVTTMLVNFRGGPFLQFDCHWVLDPDWTCGSTQSFEIICERGLIRHKWFGLEWHTEDDKGEFQSSRNATDGVRTQGDRWEHYHALIDAIENGTKLSPDEHDGLRYVRMQDAALRSAAAGQPIQLNCTG